MGIIFYVFDVGEWDVGILKCYVYCFLFGRVAIRRGG